MLESIKKYFKKEPPIPKEESPKKPSEVSEGKERKILELLIEKLRNTPVEDYQKIIELAEKIKAVYEKKIIGWYKEGKLGEKDIIAEYQAGGAVNAANFSPEGDKVVIGTSDGKMMVISLIEKDEKGKPKVLAEYQAEGVVWAANFSPDGDKVVIGGTNRKIIVIG